MAGNGLAQWMMGYMVQQELLTTPTKDRSSFAPQRFEYIQKFLVLAIRNGRLSAAHELAGAYIAAQRDVAETAAWLRIADRISTADGALLQDYERQGIIVLSNEQRAESLRVADALVGRRAPRTRSPRTTPAPAAALAAAWLFSGAALLSAARVVFLQQSHALAAAAKPP
jgi:hypothetical protein